MSMVTYVAGEVNGRNIHRIADVDGKWNIDICIDTDSDRAKVNQLMGVIGQLMTLLATLLEQAEGGDSGAEEAAVERARKMLGGN